MTRIARALSCLGLSGLLAGCSAAEAEREDRCTLTVWYRPDRLLADPDTSITEEQARRPELIGSWDGFRRPGRRDFTRRVDRAGREWYSLALTLPPGAHHYAIVVGDTLVLDERNGQSAFVANPLFINAAPLGTEVSYVEIPDCERPSLRALLAGAAPAPGDGLRFVVEFVPGRGGQALDEGSLAAVLGRGDEKLTDVPLALDLERGRAGQARITLSAHGLPPAKYTLTIEARDEAGRAAAPVSLSAFIEERARTEAGPPLLHDGLVYHLVVDRFRGPAGALPRPATPGRRAGGTLDGVRQAVRSGYFAALGVTTLWLSPVYENPPGLHAGRDGRLYEAYHGYWPARPREVEPQLGGAAALDALVREAHARGLRVILDAVPNHVHLDHPYYKDHPEWFHDGPSACVCGGPACGWGERIEDCWFDRYLPDMNLRHPEALAQAVDDLAWWMTRFDLDGFRIDAVPMMPRSATRRMARALRGLALRPGLDLLLLGETYTGPGAGGRREIRAFLGQRLDGLDSQFDFPLMWAIRDVIARRARGFDALEEEIEESNRAFAGAGGAIAHIIGNHDIPRFLSEAMGDAGSDPWLGPPQQPGAEADEAYARHLMAMTLLLTLPGLPVIYYGDEVALAGATDPDSRRPLPDVLRPDALMAPQREMLLRISRLGRLRQCSAALRRGARRVLAATRDHHVSLYQMEAADPVLVVLSHAEAGSVVRLASVPAGRYLDVLDLTAPRPLMLQAGPQEIPIAPHKASVYIPEKSPCARLATAP